MCEYYCDCSVCGYDKSKCEEMGDGSPFCHMFICTIDECPVFSCITFEEEYDVYDDGYYDF